MNTIKPGWTTSEFWAMIGTDIIAILTLLHVAVPANTPQLVQAMAFLLATVTTGVYVHSRGAVKSSAALYGEYPNTAATPPSTPIFPVNPSGAGAGVVFPIDMPVNATTTTSTFDMTTAPPGATATA